MSRFEKYIDKSIADKQTKQEPATNSSDDIILSLKPTYVLQIKKRLQEFNLVLSRIENWNHYEYSKKGLFQKRNLIEAIELPNYNYKDANGLILSNNCLSSNCFISKDGGYYRVYKNLPSLEYLYPNDINLYGMDIDADLMADYIFGFFPWKLYVKNRLEETRIISNDFDKELLEYMDSPIYRLFCEMEQGNVEEAVYLYFETVLASKI